MAKGKYATALFEVMSMGKMPPKGGTPSDSAQTPASAGGGGIPTPKWWFKSRSRTGEVKTMAPGQTTIAPSARTAINPIDAPDAFAAGDDSESSSQQATAASDAFTHEGEVSAAPAPTKPQPLSLSMDPERQQINLRLSYTSAMIGGVGLLVLICIAVLIGKSFSRGPSPAIAGQSTAQLRQGAPNPGVLNIPRRTENTTGGSGDNNTVRPAPEGAVGNNSTGTRTPAPRNAINEPSPPTTFFTDDPRRVVGLNYAIIQSYPDRETADKAADFLTKHGIACTVEKDLPGWKLPWSEGCVVVGIRGFDRMTSNPEVETYRKSIGQVSAKFAGSRSFKAFEPQFYKWRRSIP